MGQSTQIAQTLRKSCWWFNTRGQTNQPNLNRSLIVMGWQVLLLSLLMLGMVGADFQPFFYHKFPAPVRPKLFHELNLKVHDITSWQSKNLFSPPAWHKRRPPHPHLQGH